MRTRLAAGGVRKTRFGICKGATSTRGGSMSLASSSEIRSAPPALKPEIDWELRRCWGGPVTRNSYMWQPGFRGSSVRGGSDDSGRVVAHLETIPAACGSSSDAGGHLAVKSANRKLSHYQSGRLETRLSARVADVRRATEAFGDRVAVRCQSSVVCCPPGLELPN